MVDNSMKFQPSKEDLEHLTEWIAKSQHIIQDYDDKVLSAFVRGCEGSLQKTKKVLEEFNQLGQRYPQIIKNYDPLDQRLADYLSQAVVLTLPRRTPDGSIVYMGHLRNPGGFKSNPSKLHPIDFLRFWILSIYTYIWRNDFGSGKWIIVIDCKHSNLIHVREMTPVLLKQAVEIIQNALPIRLVAVHVINSPPFMEYLLSLVRSLAKDIISGKVYVHSTMQTFYEQIPKEILPKEYGGNEESTYTLHDRWFETLKSFRYKFLEEESKVRNLDHVRPKNDGADKMMGTFKALNLD